MAAKRKTKSSKSKTATMASQADIHDLYQRSVQSTDADCELFAEIYEELREAAPTTLREDFCGTALLSTTWCLADEEHRAIGVDLDGPTLAWARERNLEPNVEALGGRLQLVQADVLEVADIDQADIIAALNFSFCIFKQRHELGRYFGHCHKGLAEGGLLILEMFGGTKAIDTDAEIREIDGIDGVGAFDYVWEQESVNPINNDIVCHISFEFPDESKIENAFTYRWRLWSLPEIRDLLYEVGYTKVRIYWEQVEDEDELDEDEEQEEEEDEDAGPRMLEGTGEYKEIDEAEQQDSWLVYIVAEK
jgi:SAM-dependent methyltransferase